MFILVTFLLALILFFAVAAVVRGIKYIRAVRTFENADKKTKGSFLTLSIVHLVAGSLIILIYSTIAAFILLAYLNAGGGG